MAKVNTRDLPKNLFNNNSVVFNPLCYEHRVTTIGQLKETVRVTEEIINNLDPFAIKQLYECSDNDIDKLMETISDEAYRVLYGDLGVIKDSTFQYLDKLTESVEETMRVENLNYFIVSCMPEFELNWHHLEWGQYTMKYRKLAILAARDLGKSYYFSNAYCIWKMYRFQLPNQFAKNKRKDLALSQRGFIITNSQDLGKDLLEIMKGNIESNVELAKKLLPDGEGRKEGWGQENIRCKNGARLGTKSYGSAFRGRHPGYFVVDDFLKDNVLYSQTQREKATNWFHSVLMNALSKNGQCIVVGTPFHMSDLYGNLKEKQGWRVFEYPAIFPDGKITWENRYNYKELMTKREEQGNLIFSREILCRPIVSDSSIFPYDILKKSFFGMDEFKLVNNRESYKMKFDRVVTGCDFAMSASVGADSSVFTTWGIGNNDEMYLMHVWRGKGKSFLEQISILKFINSNFRPDIIVVESNQFQQIFAEIADHYGLPVMPHVTTGVNKNDLKNGLPGLAILFERMRIKLPRGDEYSIATTDYICAEFSTVAFTDRGVESVGSHDDCCMSTWQASVGIKRITSNTVLGYLED